MSLKNTSYFNPTLVSGCSLWLDGADSSTISLSGSTVTQWNDKSENGYNTTSYGGTPTLLANAINGVQSISFNGSSYLTGNNSNTGSTATFFLVATLTSGQGAGQQYTNAYAFSRGSGVPMTDYNEVFSITGLVCQNSGPSLALSPQRNGGNGPTFTPPNYNSAFIHTTVLDGTNMYGYGNGTSVGSTSSSGNFAYVIYSVGSQTYANTGPSYPASFNYFWTGYIGELIAFNTNLSTTQRQQVEGYLAWKWRLTSSLPSSHPYALSPSFGLPSLVPNAPAKTSLTYANHPVVAISGCALWFDGTDPLGTGTAPANGTSLTTWVNKGITTVTLAHGTSQPTYSANFQNGLGSVSFNNNYFSAAYSFNLQTKSAFIVCSQSNNATDSPQGILSFYGAGLDTVASTNGYGYQATQGGYGSFGWLYNIFAGGSTGYYIATGTAGANTPMGIYGNVFSNQFEQTFKDGSSVTNFTISTTPGMATNLMVGARLIGGGLRGSFFGNICEIIVYNIALSTAQRQTIEGYLAQKWGLTGNLPAGHPFKSSFPLFPSPVTGVRRIAGRRWSPTSVSNCVLWLDGADSSTFTLSSTSVTQWRDKSGNGNHMANNGTSPIYNASLINSVGGIDCTNGGSLISSGFQNSANLSFAMVAVVKSGLGFWGSFFTHGGRDTDFAVERNSIVGTTIHFQTANDNSSCGIAYTVDAPVLYFGTMTSGTSRFFESFSGGTNTTTTGTNSSTISLGSQLARVGKSDNNEVCNSFIGEIIYYTAVLGTTQRQQVEGYLAWKWGLKASLPSSHPYKLFPPSP
jgi:hypothetical protein